MANTVDTGDTSYKQIQSFDCVLTASPAEALLPFEIGLFITPSFDLVMRDNITTYQHSPNVTHKVIKDITINGKYWGENWGDEFVNHANTVYRPILAMVNNDVNNIVPAIMELYWEGGKPQINLKLSEESDIYYSQVKFLTAGVSISCVPFIKEYQ